MTGSGPKPEASRPLDLQVHETMRDIIAMACGDCKRRNYSTTKNRKKTTERLEMSKFCRFCRKHTAHKESKRTVISASVIGSSVTG